MARDVVRFLAREIARLRGDLLHRTAPAGRRHPADRRLVAADPAHLGRLPSEDPPRVVTQAGLDRAGADRVHCDAPGGVADPEPLLEPDHPGPRVPVAGPP